MGYGLICQKYLQGICMSIYLYSVCIRTASLHTAHAFTYTLVSGFTLAARMRVEPWTLSHLKRVLRIKLGVGGTPVSA